MFQPWMGMLVEDGYHHLYDRYSLSVYSKVSKSELSMCLSLITGCCSSRMDHTSITSLHQGRRITIFTGGKSLRRAFGATRNSVNGTTNSVYRPIFVDSLLTCLSMLNSEHLSLHAQAESGTESGRLGWTRSDRRGGGRICAVHVTFSSHRIPPKACSLVAKTPLQSTACAPQESRRPVLLHRIRHLRPRRPLPAPHLATIPAPLSRPLVTRPRRSRRFKRSHRPRAPRTPSSRTSRSGARSSGHGRKDKLNI